MSLSGDGGGGMLPVVTITAAASSLQVKRKVQGQVRKEHGRAGSVNLIGRQVGEEDGGPGPPVLAEEEGRIGVVDV